MGVFYQLTDQVIVVKPLEEVWDFFSGAENLPRITPEWMHFRIVTPQPIAMHQDALIDYTIRVSGVPVKWKTRIIDWSPPRQFIDLQLRGPYTLWHHQHTFEAVAPFEGGGTRCRDRVTYKLPAGPIGRVMNRLMVRRQLREIFGYRREAIGKLLAPVRPLQDIRIERV